MLRQPPHRNPSDESVGTVAVEMSAAKALPEPPVAVRSTERLVDAGDVRIPVGVASLRVLLPRPDMDLVERRQPIAIGCADIAQQIPLQRRQTAAGVLRRPDALD